VFIAVVEGEGRCYSIPRKSFLTLSFSLATLAASTHVCTGIRITFLLPFLLLSSVVRASYYSCVDFGLLRAISRIKET
jgi:hypothetical protein